MTDAPTNEFVPFEEANLGAFQFPTNFRFTVGASYAVTTPPAPMVLGTGHFGTVYFANGDTGPVAVKALERRGGTPEGQIANEIRILKSLGKHPNIVEYHGEYEFSKECIFLVTQYGGTSLGQLRERISGHPGWNMLLAKYTRDVVEGLYHLHEHCFVLHRDVKPDNIVIIDDTAKLTDFGISRRIDHNGNMGFEGTVRYMAPEVLSGRIAASKNPACDIWSLGMTILELYYGQHPVSYLHDIRDDWRFFLPKLYRDKVDFFQRFAVDFPIAFPGLYGECLENFLRQCLIEPKDRSSSGDLLSHPFLLLKEDGTFDYTNAGTLEPPAVTPAGCRNDSISGQNVLLRFDVMLGTEAYFSINHGNYQRYTGLEPVELRWPGNYTVRVYSQTGRMKSRVGIHTYYLSEAHAGERPVSRTPRLQKPTLDPCSGTYQQPSLFVALSAEENRCEIRWTSGPPDQCPEPTMLDQLYHFPITLPPGNVAVKAVAFPIQSYLSYVKSWCRYLLDASFSDVSWSETAEGKFRLIGPRILPVTSEPRAIFT